MRILSIAIGGFCGSIARYSINILFFNLHYPIATFLVNIIGSFLLAFLYTISTKKMPPTIRAGLGVGFCGSFTTFSTFSLELVSYINNEQWLQAIFYGGSSVFFGLLLAYLGFALAKRLGGELQ